MNIYRLSASRVGTKNFEGEESSSCGKRKERLSVLAVDDEPQVRRLVVRVLNPRLFDVTCVGDANEALQTALRIVPKIVLLDIHLSAGQKSEGIACLRSLRQAGFSNPIYILSADNTVEQARLAAKFGADGYLVKGEDGFWERLEKMILSAVSGCPSKFTNLSAATVSYLETLGFSERDIELLDISTVDWPREKEIADTSGRTFWAVRKSFERIRKRLGAKSQVDLGRIMGVLTCFSETSLDDEKV